MPHRYLLAFAFLLAASPALGQAAEDVTLTYDGTDVTIDRDEFGVPHVIADTEPAVFFGQGFATAQDRLFQMETFWRVATGRLAEINPGGDANGNGVPDNAEQDQQIRTVFYTPAERQEQFDALPEPIQDMLSAYVDGINVYIDSTAANPDVYLPFEYTQPPLNAIGIEAWDIDKAVAVMQFFMRRFGEIGGQELERLAELEANGEQWFNENRPINDPSAPTTIALGDRPAPAHATGYSGPPIDPAVAAEVRARREHLDAVLVEAGVPLKLGSFAAVVAGDRTATGNVMLLGAPQMGQPSASAKAVTSEVELLVGDAEAPEDATLHVAGMTVPGIPGVIIGRNAGQTWTLTTGVTDNTDTYVEILNETNQQYLYEGAFVPFEVIPEQIGVLGQEPISYVHFRTVHGPVYAADFANNQAFTWKYAFWERELDMAAAFYDAWKAETLADFAAAAEQVTMSFNLFYADKAQNIAYWHVGLYPERPGTADPRLPLIGTGEEEWEGFLDFGEHPQSVNPAKGYFVNWNNKPVAWWNHGDVMPWTEGAGRAYDGVTFLDAHLQDCFPVSFDALQELTCVVRSNPEYPEYPGTYQQVVVLAEEGSYARNVVPPGQSGFVNTAGVPSPHFADQWPFYLSSIDCEDVTMGPFSFIGETPISVAAEDGAAPEALTLEAGYPNPARGTVTAAFALPEAGPVALRLYDLLGREVRTVVDGERPAGAQRVTFGTGGLSAGVYVLRLTADGRTVSRKLTVVR